MKYSMALATVLAACVSSAASAAYINNGDFELQGTDRVFSYWNQTGTPGTLNPGIDASHSLLLVKGSSDVSVSQLVSGSLTNYQIDLDLAISNLATTTTRTFGFIIKYANSAQINFRIVKNSSNQSVISVYSGSTWSDLLTNALTFSSSQNSLNVNHLKIVVDSANSTYNLYVTNASGSTVQSLNNTAFQTASPASSSLSSLNFSTASWVTNSWSVIDNVQVTAVPEPAAVTSLSLLMTGGLMIRRR